jgi:integrase
MANPLILPTGRQALMQQMGRERRQADRQKEDERSLRKAMAIFRQHLPEMLEEPPDARRFESTWPQIDSQLRSDLKNEVAYRRAHSFICDQIEKGNRFGIWSVTPPPAYFTLRRNRPLRTLSWQQRSVLIADAEQTWFGRLAGPVDAPDRLFAQLLLSGIFYGGLNRPPLWPALGVALTASRPLQGNRDYCWLTLKPPSSTSLASNFYQETDTQHGRIAVSEVHYVPDPISLGLLRQFLLNRPADWQPPASEAQCLALIRSELGMNFSFKDLNQGGATIAESQPSIALPQVLVEYAVGRQPSASLPTPYWRRLLSPGLLPCEETQYARFHPITVLQQRQSGTSKDQPRKGSAFLLTRLRDVFKHDRAKPKGKSAIVAELTALDEPNLTLCEQVLVHWLLSHLTERGNAISTASAYLDTVGADWLATALHEALDTYTGEDFCELYQCILNRPRSQKARDYQAGRLEDMHQFAVQQFDFAPLPDPLNEGSSVLPHVSAAIVDEPLFAGLLHQVDRFADVDELHGRMLKCFLIMAYRTGLRPGELAKLRLEDIEPSPIGFLFVRENKHGHNKTDAAERRVPLYPLLTEDEQPLVSRYIGERRLQAKSKSELLFYAQGNPHEAVDTKQLSLMVKTVLADLSGGLYYRLYHLRHSALSRLQLLLHHDLVDLPQPVQAFLPYSPAKRETILHLIAGKGRLRDRYPALAAFAGHSSATISISTYLHFTDLLLGSHLANNRRELTPDAAKALLGLRQNRILTLGKSGDITPTRLLDYSRKRLVRYMAPLPVINNPAWSAPQESSRASHYVQSLAVLERIQAGYDYREIAWFYQLTQQQVLLWLDSAIALRNLATSKGTSRLFPKSRRHQLLPAEPVGIEELKDVAKALNDCRTLNRKEEQQGDLRWTIQYCLLNCNSSRAGIRFTQSADFTRFMAVVSQLFPWDRWQLLLQYPRNQRLSSWNCHPDLSIKREPLKKQAQFPEGLGWLFLRHAREDIHISRGLSRYSSHSLRILFHRLAIVLFPTEQIRRWQPPSLLEQAKNLADNPLTYASLKELMQLERQAQGEEARLIGQLWRDAYLTADEEAITRLCDESNRHAGSKSP